jgi:hypothetical protein
MKPQKRYSSDLTEVLKSGCHWEILPKDLPPSGTVFDYFNHGRKEKSGSR